MRHPLNNVFITQRFGERPEVYKQFGLKGHNGLDYRAPTGTPVFASFTGQVKERADQGKKGYGRFVRVRGDKYEAVYAHFNDWSVALGQVVSEGQLLGHTDNTGFSSGSHLHFGVRPIQFNSNNGFAGYIDPIPLIQGVSMPPLTKEQTDKLFSDKAKRSPKPNEYGATELQTLYYIADDLLIRLQAAGTQLDDLNAQLMTKDDVIAALKEQLENQQTPEELSKKLADKIVKFIQD